MNISITFDSGETKDIDVYSPDGLELLTELWSKTAYYHRVMYEPTWLGIPIIQFPNDMVMLQELIWKVRPDVIVETGVAHGGSAILFASVLELLGRGKVIGVDIEIRQYNRVAIQAHPISKRIELIEGSSIAEETVDKVKEMIPSGHSVLVVLDSNHSYEHVLAEMEIYHHLVPPGGYMVVMDGIQSVLGTTPQGKAEWEHDNPLTAINEFVSKHPDWEIDPYYNRMRITCAPSGFVRRGEIEEQ